MSRSCVPASCSIELKPSNAALEHAALRVDLSHLGNVDWAFLIIPWTASKNCLALCPPRGDAVDERGRCRPEAASSRAKLRHFR